MDTDNETLEELISRIRDLEDFINSMIDIIKPGEDHFCTEILGCGIEEMRESREFARLNHLCDVFEMMAEIGKRDGDEEESISEDEGEVIPSRYDSHDEKNITVTQKDV